MLRDVLRPWGRPGDLWWGLAHLLSGVVVGPAAFVPVITLAIASVPLLIVFPLAAVTIWFLFGTARLTGRVERSRYRALIGEELQDPQPYLEGRTWWGRWKERLRSRARWKEVVYALVRLPLSVAWFLVVYLTWCASVAVILLPFYVSRMPGGTAKLGHLVFLEELGVFEVGPGMGAVLAAASGVVGLVLVAPWATWGMVWADRWVGRLLLHPRPTGDLGERVAHLEASRSAVVDSAEAERRRIERDLHDGAQQRLVALAVGLGTAREKLKDDPDAGRQLVDEAHREAKAALKELRDLVRGIHPVILEDRGLDAALSAVVARMPLPVDLQVEVAERPPAVVESTAYFVVTEALTNVARHADATRASVAIVRAGDRLVVEVSDNGRGGADPTRGTGLAGLKSRVEALDGRLDVISSPGGPTTLLVEVPCGS